MIVRPASLVDADVIVRFRMELLKEHGRHPIYGRVREDAVQRARRSTALQLASGRQITYLAFDGRQAVGMLRCIDARGSPLLVPPRYAYIASVFVVASHRRGGVLRRLLDAAIVWSRARGLTEMRVHATVDNTLANAAWERLGFGSVELLRRRELSRAPGV
ncbi:MAG TPA: GNAT family N-acetyltransferase [Gemmatimonadaceae bacterium]|nr:GNAT family N-acetyltransferase [Gemmatimonadaceae bacterium]